MFKMFLRLSTACLGIAGLTTAIAAYAEPTPPAKPPIWEQVAALPSGTIVVLTPTADRAGAPSAPASAAATSARPMEADLMLRLKTEMRQAMLDALRAEMRR